MEQLLISIPVLIFSAILHEYMHGWVAEKLGDPTARHAGRLTLNPIPHIDPMSSVLIPLMMLIISQGQFVFAAAKPVPVNPLRLRDGRKDLALVALAGPLTNLGLAVGAAAILKLTGGNFLSFILFPIVYYNLLLAIFNLIPIPPLDGSKFFSLFMPARIAYQYLAIAPFGMFLLFFLLFFPIGGFSLGNLLSTLLMQSLKLLGIY